MVLTAKNDSPGTQKGLQLVVGLVHLMAFSIPLPIRINSIVTLIAVVLCAGFLIMNRRLDRKAFSSPLFLLVVAQLVILVIGLLHSPNVPQGLADIERFSFALVFILLFSQFKNMGLGSDSIVISFIVGCLVTTLYAFVYTFLIMDDAGRSQVLEYGHLAFTDPIRIHPTYLSIYLIFGFFFLIELWRLNRALWSRKHIAVIGIALLYIAILIFFIRSQVGLLIFAALLVLYPLILMRRRGAIVTFILFATGLLVFLVDRDRVATVFDTYGKNVSSALDNRFKMWDGAIAAVKIKPFFGAGTGGQQTLLNEGYSIAGYEEGVALSYNAHNQYLEFMARNGLLELLCFVALLSYLFWQSLKRDNRTFVLFNMIVALAMLAESFLSVQKGIVFFYFFVAVFSSLPDRPSRPAAEGGQSLFPLRNT